MKIIQINNYSHSLLTKNLEQGIFDDWYARTGIYLKKYFPNYEIECWTPERTYKKEKVYKRKGIIFRVFPSSVIIRYGREISFPMLKALKEEINKNDIILHMHEFHSLQSYIINLLYGKKIPIIAQHHGGRAPLKHIRKKWYYVFAFPWLLIEQVLERIALKNVSYFFVLNKAEYHYLSTFINKNKIRLQTMGVDFDQFKHFNKRVSRNTLKLPQNKIIAIYVGSLIKRKCINNLIYAAKELIKLEPNFLVLIIGSGPEEGNLKNLVKKLNLEKNVLIPGYVDSKDLVRYLSASDVYVLPSSWEGASVALIEAMACDLPVIATDVGNARYMVDNFKTGILIKPKSIDSIIKAFRFYFKNKKTFKNIRNKAKQIYDWKVICERTVDIYKKLV